MINMEFFKKQIEVMDVKSTEFFDIYAMVCDKYYTVKDPDDFQKSTILLRMYIDKAVNHHESQLIAFEKILTELYSMDKSGSKACMGMIGFNDTEYQFTIATDDKQLKSLQDMLGKASKGKFKND